jgi:hypothetical protein
VRAVKATLILLLEAFLPLAEITRPTEMKKRERVLVWCSVLAIICSVATAVAAVLGRPATEPDPALRAYRTIDEVIAIHRSQGWKVVSAPTDGKRYRICGATRSDSSSGMPTASGSFRTGDRSVTYEIEVPEGKQYAIEGLDPIDGGPLTFMVLECPMDQDVPPQ